MKKAPKTVEAYVRTFPKDVQARLRKMRATIKKAAPTAVESVTYGMIGYKLEGRPLVYLGGFKHHVGFFAMPSSTIAFKKELVRYKGGKSALQFHHDEPLPLPLVTKIVKFRIREYRAKDKNK